MSAARTSYKISRLEVIFMGPWGTEPVPPFLHPLTRLVGPHCSCNVALLRNGTGRFLVLFPAGKSTSARAWPPFPWPANTTPGATLFSHCRTPTKRHRSGAPLPLPANSTPGATLFSHCRTPTKRHRSGPPSLCPLTRLAGPPPSRFAAPYRNATEPVPRPWPSKPFLVGTTEPIFLYFSDEKNFSARCPRPRPPLQIDKTSNLIK